MRDALGTSVLVVSEKSLDGVDVAVAIWSAMVIGGVWSTVATVIIATLSTAAVIVTVWSTAIIALSSTTAVVVAVWSTAIITLSSTTVVVVAVWSTAIITLSSTTAVVIAIWSTAIIALLSITAVVVAIRSTAIVVQVATTGTFVAASAVSCVDIAWRTAVDVCRVSDPGLAVTLVTSATAGETESKGFLNSNTTIVNIFK
jgi:hypothetical protein